MSTKKIYRVISKLKDSVEFTPITENEVLEVLNYEFEDVSKDDIVDYFFNEIYG